MRGNRFWRHRHLCVSPASWPRNLHCCLIHAAPRPAACSQQPAACVPPVAYAPHRQLQAQKQDLEAAEFQALLAGGHNPYAVYKARAAQVGPGLAGVGAVERGTWGSRCRGRGACSRAGAGCDQGSLLLRTVPGVSDACYRPCTQAAEDKAAAALQEGQAVRRSRVEAQLAEERRRRIAALEREVRGACVR